MGSKRAMLRNGLGLLLEKELASADRFVDLFAGSGAVASFAARRFALPVLAVDLQQYSVVLAEAVIGRVAALGARAVWRKWHASAQAWLDKVSVPWSENSRVLLSPTIANGALRNRESSPKRMVDITLVRNKQLGLTR